jgi:hypothetical protein
MRGRSFILSAITTGLDEEFEPKVLRKRERERERETLSS